MKFEVKSTNELHLVNGNEMVEILKKDFKGKWIRETSNEGVHDFFTYIANLTLNELPKNIYMSDFIHGSSSEYGFYGASIDKEDEDLKVSIFLAYELKSWDKIFPAKDFFEHLVSRLNNCGYEVHLYEDLGTEVEVYVDNIKQEYISDFTIKHVLESIYFPIREIEEDTYKALIESTQPDVFNKLFDFPEKYSTVCSQYILWFGEVLKRAGVQASLSTKESEFGTLLAIEHHGGNELTEKIEKLLFGYLSLPYSEYLPRQLPEDPEEKMGLLLLKNQVDQFKFNLQQVQSALEVSNIKNDMLASELSRKDDELLLLKSAQDSKLELLGGVLAVEEFKVCGITVNPKKAFELLSSSRK